MSGSILQETKKLLGIQPDYSVFDTDILAHINTVFNTLQQLGVGPANGFMAVDETNVWSDFSFDDVLLNSVKSLMYFKVRLAFDPPTTSFHLDSLKHQADEIEWRLNINRETAP